MKPKKKQSAKLRAKPLSKKAKGKPLGKALPPCYLSRWRQEVLLGPEDVYGKYPATKFGHYQESADSAMLARKMAPKVFQAPLPLDRRDSPIRSTKSEHGWVELPKDWVIHLLYFREDGRWLGACRKNISEAVENGDEAFFLHLARVIKERPKYRANSINTLHAFGRPSDPRPGTLTDRFRDMLIYNWVARPLWLMSSTVARDYIRKFAGLEITPDSYNKIKHELGLKPHPKLPVVGVTDSGELVLKAGWKFPKL